MSQHEVWKDYTGSIKQFHNLIRVSNLGRVYKKGQNTYKNRSGILKCTKTKYGYKRVHVSINGKIYNKPVHRLVAEMFCSNPRNKPFVDHVNGVCDDNRASNLRWVTASENNRNPHYIKLLKARQRKALLKYNRLAEANKKRVVVEHKDGTKLYFDSIDELKAYFHTQANVQRIIKQGHFVKSSKSVFKHWRIRLVK